MSVLVLVAAIAVLSASSFVLARGRAVAATAGGTRLHSLPIYYGWYGALWSALPGIAVTALWLAFASSLLTSLALPPGNRRALRSGSARSVLERRREPRARSFAAESVDERCAPRQSAMSRCARARC
jgi:phosphate transport system permease protein